MFYDRKGKHFRPVTLPGNDPQNQTLWQHKPCKRHSFLLQTALGSLPPQSRANSHHPSLPAVDEDDDAEKLRGTEERHLTPAVLSPGSAAAARHPTLSARSRLSRTPSAAHPKDPRAEEEAKPRGRKGSKMGQLKDWVKLRTERMDSKVLITQGDDSDSDYDTDLEGEINEDREYLTNRSLYMKMCRLYGVTPMKYFLRHMNDSSLVIKHACLGPCGVKALAVPLQINTHVTSLNLEGNSIKSEGTRHVAYMLSENNFITELNLAWNGLESEGARLICDSLYDNRIIKKLNLTGNGFLDKDAELFAKLMETNGTLRDLNLSNNEFRELGAIILGKAIGSNETLVKLNLSWNHIRLKGADAIAKAMKTNSRLEVLNLAMNGFGNSGAASLGQALMVNTSLQELDITNNRIHLEGCQGLAQGLAKNSGLTLLEMGLNPITFVGAKTLIKAVERNENSTLEYLDLSGALVQQDFMDTVESIKHERPNFDVYVSFVSKSTGAGSGKDIDKFGDKNPLEIMLIYMAEKKLRLVDLFKSLDKDQSGSLERDEFIDGLQSVDTPLSVAQLDELIRMLDKDGDGEIDIGEILNINKEFRDIKMKAQKTAKEKEKQQKARNKFRGTVATVKLVNSLSHQGTEIFSDDGNYVGNNMDENVGDNE